MVVTPRVSLSRRRGAPTECPLLWQGVVWRALPRVGHTMAVVYREGLWRLAMRWSHFDTRSRTRLKDCVCMGLYLLRAIPYIFVQFFPLDKST